MTTQNKPALPDRTATKSRSTRETEISVSLNLDAAEPPRVSTGLGFFDHMLTALGTHAQISLSLECKGDLEVDDHHTIEDCAIVLGAAFDEALGDRRGIERFGSAYAPLDESLARSVIDLSGRASCSTDLRLTREMIGSVACENVPHFFSSWATSSRSTVHVDVIRGINDHHKAEAAFKSFAIALRSAIARTGTDAIPSTKGAL